MSDLGSARRLAKRSGVGSLTTTNDGSVLDRMQRDRADVRRKRLLFRCWHRERRRPRSALLHAVRLPPGWPQNKSEEWMRCEQQIES